MVVIMATSTPVVNAVTASSVVPLTEGAVKSSIKVLLIAALVGAVIALLGSGGTLYYFVKSGRILIRGEAIKLRPAVPSSTHLLALDPLLVNLADRDANTYLRLSLTLQVADAAKKDSETKGDKNADDKTAAVRDTVLAVLGRQTADSLLAPDGKEHLKTELKQALTAQNGDLKVQKIFFTEFLIQR